MTGKRIMSIIRLFLVVLFASIITNCREREKLNVHVTLGLFTPYRFIPEILNGRVIAILEENNSPSAIPELSGDSVDEPAVLALYGSAPAFTAYFDTTGLVTKVSYPSGEINKYWLVDKKNDRYSHANRVMNDSIVFYMKFSYDSDNDINLISRYRAHTNVLMGMEKFRYNPSGEISETDYLKPDSTLQEKIELEWDNNHHVTKIDFLNPDGQPSGSILLTYNNEGFIENQKILDSRGREKGNIRNTYDYDVMGNWVKKTSVNGSDRRVSTRTYTYR